MAAREPARTKTKAKTNAGPEPRPGRGARNAARATGPEPKRAGVAQDGAGAGRTAGAAQAPDRPHPGAALLTANYIATGLFAACSVAATIFPHDLSIVAAIVDLVLFAAGCAAFFWSYATAVARSRSDEIALAGLFFLSESAPREVAVRFRVVLAVQVVVAVVAASIRPFTPLAFGVLVPVLGLGLMGLWGARYGTFPPRHSPADNEGDEA